MLLRRFAYLRIQAEVNEVQKEIFCFMCIDLIQEKKGVCQLRRMIGICFYKSTV